MRNLLFKFILVSICLLFFSTQCDEDRFPIQEDEQQELATLKSEIESLASSSVCNESTECKFIGLGSKPCGGPWSYLVYSTTIDIENIKSLVETYNNKETAFNTKWGIASDCSIAIPPTSIECKNNKCVPVF